MDPAARLARPGDAGELERLETEAAEEVRAQRGGAAYLARELSSDGPTTAGARLSVVVDLEGAPVGFARASLERVEGLGLLCRLEALYVEPGARGVGAGEVLARFVEDWASEHGAEALDALVLPGAREAKNLFESLGYSARLLVMQRGPLRQ